MAIQSRTTLKSYFETGDVPTQTEFSDLLDTTLLDEDVLYTDEVEIYRALGSAVVAEGVGGNLFQVAGSAAMTAGQQYIQAIRIRKSENIAGLKFLTAITGIFTASDENSVALYSYDGAGTINRVAISADDPNIWKQSTSGLSLAAFSSPYAATKGLYFMSILLNYSGQTAIPNLRITTAASSAGMIGDFTNSAKLIATKTGVTAHPTSTTLSTFTQTGTRFWLSAYK